MEALLDAYDWPGNIRELQNVIERAVALEKSEEIRLDSLPLEVHQPRRRSRPGRAACPDRGSTSKRTWRVCAGTT